MMDSEAEQAFLLVADLAAPERERQMQAMPDDLRCRVQSLIEADALAHGYFASAVTNVATSVRDSGAGAFETGTRVGPYRIVGVLGRGGMGMVYEAARDDSQFEQRAAIKIVEANAGLLPRFQVERQILARLSHPNIARLLDGGSTGGAPYFVMELVEDARPIDKFCEGMPVRQIVNLFLPVCKALEYVHGNLVVHGDIKASNILVDGAGTPKLVDFGIARILEAQTRQAEQTRTLALTLSCASPEQVLGQPLTTATDVYGLAGVLYRALTGHPALDTANQPLAVAVEMIRNQEPAPALRFRPEIGLDLSRILDKALRKAPAERYSSIEALRQDLEAFLAGRPVAARGAATLYRAGKFARRYWLPIAAAALVVALAVAAFVGVTRSAARAEEQRVLAETQRGAADAARKQAEIQRGVAENALRQTETMRLLAEGKTAEAEAQRGVASERLQSERDFTDVFTRLVDDNFLFGSKDSLRILDGWIDTQEADLKKKPTDLAVKRLTGFLHYRRCAARVRTNLRSGEGDCQIATQMLEPFVRGAATEDWVLRTHMSAHVLLSQIYAGTARAPEAIRSGVRAVELADMFPSTDFAGYRYRLTTRSGLANVYLATGRVDEAVRLQEQAFRIWDQRPRFADITGPVALYFPATIQRYSQMLMAKDPAKAELQMQRALNIYGDLARQKTAGCLELNEYANALNSSPFPKQRDPETSIRMAEKAVAACPLERRALVMDTLAWAYFYKGETAKATGILTQAIETLPAGPSPLRAVLQSSLKDLEKAAATK